MHLPEFGWTPVILTVHENFYEEPPDRNLEKLLPENLRIEKVNAFPLSKPRIIGDLGIRALWQLYKKGKQLIEQEQIDFLYILIPSFYTALLGRWLHASTGIKYGIDYIDPWVHHFPGSDKLFSRHWFSTKLAKFLEPIAVKKVSLITGVAEGYYADVLKRNPHLKGKVITGAMPYGGEETDHIAVKQLNPSTYLFEKKKEKFQFVYAGAMLPKAYQPLARVFETIKVNKELFHNTEFHFIGTGSRPNDPDSYNIKAMAEEYELWNTNVFEYPKRIPYLDVLAHLNIADAVFILGSTEPHYTPSKTYQGVLSQKPIFAILHSSSTAAPVLQNAGAGVVLAFNGESDLQTISNSFINKFQDFLAFAQNFDPSKIDKAAFDQYSARNTTMYLSNLLNQAVLTERTVYQQA